MGTLRMGSNTKMLSRLLSRTNLFASRQPHFIYCSKLFEEFTDLFFVKSMRNMSKINHTSDEVFTTVLQTTTLKSLTHRRTAEI
jgi:hypothetical protein